MTEKDAGAAQEAAPESETAPATEAAPVETEEASEAAIWNELDADEKAKAASDGEKPDDAGDRPAEDPTGAQAEAVSPKDGDKPAVDIWKDAPEPLRLAHKAAEKELEDLRQYKRSQVGRHASYQRDIASLKDQLKEKAGATGATVAPEKQGDKKPPAEGTQADQAPALPPALQRAIEEYPEVAGPLAEVLGQQAKTIEELKQNLTALAKSKDGDARERYIDAQTDALIEVHPDWLALTGFPGKNFPDEKTRKEAADKFSAWLSKQPRYVQKAAAENGDEVVDAEAAIDLIGRYKAHLREAGQTTQPANPGTPPKGATPNPAPSAKRARQLESASVPRTPSPGVTPTGIPDDPEAAWRAYERMEL